MSSEQTRTKADCMKVAFQAILVGDYAERNRLCQRAEMLTKAEQQSFALQRAMSVDFYVGPDGVAMPMLTLAGAGM